MDKLWERWSQFGFLMIIRQSNTKEISAAYQITIHICSYAAIKCDLVLMSHLPLASHQILVWKLIILMVTEIWNEFLY